MTQAFNTPEEQFGAFTGTVVTTLVNIDQNKDKRIQMSEIISTVYTLGLEAVRIYGSIGDALKALRSGTEARDRFIAQLRLTFDLPDDVLELLIEDTIAFLEDGATLFSRWGSFMQKPAA